ncbi:MAG: TMF family protein [Bacteroidaceae bacterium]|nr:TMF family protein [Bacteroidaceae bacterium]
MEFSVILNWILGGGLITAIISIITLKATVREANAKAEKAMAEGQALRIDNVEHATRILMENIVKPLTEQLNATIKSLQSMQREVARLRKSLSVANSCKHADNCPVLFKLRDLSKDGGYETGDLFAEHRGQHCIRSDTENGGKNSNVGSEVGDPDGKPP